MTIAGTSTMNEEFVFPIEISGDFSSQSFVRFRGIYDPGLRFPTPPPPPPPQCDDPPPTTPPECDDPQLQGSSQLASNY